MQTYEITYRVLPAGVGPDDYEPADLEQRTGQFQLPDPGPEDHCEVNGQQHTYGPSVPALQAEVAKTLQPGETPIINLPKLRKIN
ncbi:hypothetical protein AB0903_27420 [Streptomyces sp. NPDC048389]|uniref:hypothetical protein n=1 Tax=Streptomyces sp. NPDC048389 TaxID=3154622 RepID=UPI0034533FB7